MVVLGTDDLVLCAGTLLHAPLAERARAVRDAGFTAMSLWAEDYAAARASGLADADIRALLADHGLAIAELDGISRWLPKAAEEELAFGHDEAEIFALAEAVGGRSVNVMQIFGSAVPAEVAAQAFAGVCDRARERGLLVHLELLPWSGIPDLRAAWEIVRLADRSNGGLMLDTWHHARSCRGDLVKALEDVPGERVFAIQLADAPAQSDGDLLDETMNRRRLPGEGDVPLAAIVRRLRQRGCKAPVGIEVFSEALRALPADEGARRSAEAARAVIAQAKREKEAER